MSRMVVKCPVCDYKESVISTSANAEMPPCPRCDDFIRMADITPVGGQVTVISTAGSRRTEDQATVALPKPVVAPKRRDQRDFGPEPRA
jgi:hypothetical protein